MRLMLWRRSAVASALSLGTFCARAVLLVALSSPLALSAPDKDDVPRVYNKAGTPESPLI